MKARMTCTIAGTLILNIWAGLATADNAKSTASADAAAKAFAESAAPGAAHAKLKPLAGKWTYTCRLWMEPGKPPIETTGTIVRKWILGGRFLSEKVAGTGLDGKPGFEGFGMYGYDNNLKRYTSSFVCNMGTGTSTGVGVATDSNTFTFESQCSCPLEKKRIIGRDVIRIESPQRIVFESYKKVEGREMKVFELVTTRKTK